MKRYRSKHGGDVYVYGIRLRTDPRIYTVRVDPCYLKPCQSTLFTRCQRDYGTIDVDIATSSWYNGVYDRVASMEKAGSYRGWGSGLVWQIVNYHAHTIQLFFRRVVRVMAAKRTFDFFVHTHSEHCYLHDPLVMQNVLSFLL
jgi:hypothetical protein